MMSVEEYRRLQLAMAATTHDEDVTALAGLRTANAILKAHDLTWQHVFNRLVVVEYEIEPDPERDAEKDAIAALVGRAELNARGSHRDLVAAIRDHFYSHGSIDARQRQILETAARG